MANEVRIRATVDDKVSGSLDKIRDKFDTVGKSAGFKSIVQGVGIGAGISAYGLLDRAVSGLIGVMGDAVQAAMKDEESQNRLRASLLANVPAWNGSTDAIEKNILAAQHLGFNDEQLRDSLTVLVGATHDVGKAQKIMSTAMDLARFKGIDLRTASEALIKVEGGHYRALAQLGIKLKDNATSTEALAAVQAVASGQAEAYANTNSGKLLAAQVKLDEAMENFGYVVMPTVIDVTVQAADAASGLVDTLTKLSHITELTNSEQTDLAGNILDAAAAVPFFGSTVGPLRDAYKAMQDGAKDTAADVEGMRGDIHDGLEAVTGDFQDASDSIAGTTSDIGDDFAAMRGRIGDELGKAATMAKDHGGLTVKAYADGVLASQKLVTDAFDVLTGLQEHELTWAQEQAQIHGQLTSKAVADGLKDGRGAVHDAAQNVVLTGYQRLEQLVKSGAPLGKQAMQDLANGIKSKDPVIKTAAEHVRSLVESNGKPRKKPFTDAGVAAGKAAAAGVRAGFGVITLTAVNGVRRSIRDTHGPGHGATEFNAAGAVGFTNGPTASPTGGIMGEAGSEAYAILRNPRPISGGGLGGNTFNVTLNVGAGSGLSAGAARQFVNEVGPALYADMQRKGFLPRAGNGLTG